MRKANCMNDFMEAVYGLECLTEAYNSEIPGRRFRGLLDGIFDGFCTSLQDYFNGWRLHFETDTYLTCLSEHDDKEDTIGRLSMWRAYGGTTGIAFVVNPTAFLSPSDPLKAYSSPVAYLSKQQFADQLGTIADSIEANKDFVKGLGREAVFMIVFQMFRFGALCAKHPGFHEEREWRIVYSPQFDKSERLVRDTQAIFGTPQPIYKIKLEDVPEKGFTGVAIPQLLNRIIIGPTQYGLAIREAFIDALTEVGVANAGEKVLISDIPFAMTHFALNLWRGGPVF